MSPHLSRHDVCGSRNAHCGIPWVAGKHLVTAHTAEDHLEPFGCGAANEVGSDSRRIRDGIIEMVDEPWKKVDDLRLEHLLVIVDAESLRDVSRISQIIRRDVVAQIL